MGTLNPELSYKKIYREPLKFGQFRGWKMDSRRQDSVTTVAENGGLNVHLQGYGNDKAVLKSRY